MLKQLTIEDALDADLHRKDIWQLIKAKEYFRATELLEAQALKNGLTWSLQYTEIHVAEGKLDSALEILRLCTERHPNILRARGRCLEAMGRLHEAEIEYKSAYEKVKSYNPYRDSQPTERKLLDTQTLKANVTSSYACCLAKIGRVQEATQLHEEAFELSKTLSCRDVVHYNYAYHLKNIDKKKSDEIIANLISQFPTDDRIPEAEFNRLLNQGHIKTAEKSVKSWLDRNPTSVKAHLCYGNLLREKSMLEDAQQQFEKALTHSTDAKQKYRAQYSIAKNYYELGNYDAAREIHHTMYLENRHDKNAYLSYARFLQDTDYFKDALMQLEVINQTWPNDSKIILAQACCYDAQGDYVNAHKKFCEAFEAAQLDADRTNILLKHANYYVRQQNYPQAIKLIELSLNYTNDLRCTLLQIEILHKSGEYEKAHKLLFALEKVHGKDQDKKIILATAHFYESCHDSNLAIKYFKLAIEKFPYYIAAYVSYAHHLLKQKKPLTLEFLENALKRFPTNRSLLELKIKFHFTQYEADKAKPIINRLLQKFSTDKSLLIFLLIYNLQTNQREAARTIQETCEKNFPDNYRLLDKIAKILHSPSPAVTHSLSVMNEETQVEVPQINLTERVKDLFAELTPHFPHVFLVGSTVMNSLIQQRMDKSYQHLCTPTPDTDILLMTDSTDALIRLGFMQNVHVPCLWKRDDVDIIVVPNTQQAFEENIRNRCLYNCTFYCDQAGNVYDLDGGGFIALYQKQLRIIGDAQERLRNNPSIVLRCIKYMALGFVPSEDVHANLQNIPPEYFNNHKSRLYAIAHKELSNPNAEDFVALLIKYGLLQKLFSLEPQKYIRHTIHELNSLLFPDENKNLAPFIFKPKKEKKPAALFQPAPQLPKPKQTDTDEDFSKRAADACNLLNTQAVKIKKEIATKCQTFKNSQINYEEANAAIMKIFCKLQMSISTILKLKAEHDKEKYSSKDYETCMQTLLNHIKDLHAFLLLLKKLPYDSEYSKAEESIALLINGLNQLPTNETIVASNKLVDKILKSRLALCELKVLTSLTKVMKKQALTYKHFGNNELAVKVLQDFLSSKLKFYLERFPYDVTGHLVLLELIDFMKKNFQVIDTKRCNYSALSANSLMLAKLFIDYSVLDSAPREETKKLIKHFEMLQNTTNIIPDQQILSRQ